MQSFMCVNTLECLSILLNLGSCGVPGHRVSCNPGVRDERRPLADITAEAPVPGITGKKRSKQSDYTPPQRRLDGGSGAEVQVSNCRACREARHGLGRLLFVVRSVAFHWNLRLGT